jgi:hypothetical protein
MKKNKKQKQYEHLAKYLKKRWGFDDPQAIAENQKNIDLLLTLEIREQSFFSSGVPVLRGLPFDLDGEEIIVPFEVLKIMGFKISFPDDVRISDMAKKFFTMHLFESCVLPHRRYKGI